MTFFYTTRYVYALLLLFIAVGCKMPASEQKLKEYDLGQPEKFNMPESLAEISGIAFSKGTGNIYAIQDEQGKLFRLTWGVKKQAHTKFSKMGDYEDVAIAGDKVIVLKSNGTL